MQSALLYSYDRLEVVEDSCLKTVRSVAAAEVVEMAGESSAAVCLYLRALVDVVAMPRCGRQETQKALRRRFSIPEAGVDPSPAVARRCRARLETA